MVRIDKLRKLPSGLTMTIGVIFAFYFIQKSFQPDNTHRSFNRRSAAVIGNRKVGHKTVSSDNLLTDHNPGTVHFDLDYVQENMNSLDQTDPRLTQYAMVRYLTPPSRLPYSDPNFAGYKTKHLMWVVNFFENKRNGTFIEAGANNGLSASHTFHLEKNLGWSGLLIECNPMVIPYLKTVHRKAWLATVCLAPTTTPGTLKFNNPKNWDYSGRLGKPWNLTLRHRSETQPTPWTSFDVETIPLYTLLDAIGLKEIDFFLFDVEGSELAVLKTLPFDEIIFKVMIIETYFYNEEEKEELETLLVSNGYTFVTNLTNVDNVYIHNSVKDMLNQENDVI